MIPKVGDVVKLRVSLLGNPSETIGICYQVYDSASGSYIFENSNYDGFAPDERAMFLDPVGFDNNVANYRFTNVMKLSNDFESGRFDTTFKRRK